MITKEEADRQRFKDVAERVYSEAISICRTKLGYQPVMKVRSTGPALEGINGRLPSKSRKGFFFSQGGKEYALAIIEKVYSLSETQREYHWTFISLWDFPESADEGRIPQVTRVNHAPWKVGLAVYTHAINIYLRHKQRTDNSLNEIIVPYVVFSKDHITDLTDVMFEYHIGNNLCGKAFPIGKKYDIVRSEDGTFRYKKVESKEEYFRVIPERIFARRGSRGLAMPRVHLHEAALTRKESNVFAPSLEDKRKKT